MRTERSSSTPVMEDRSPGAVYNGRKEKNDTLRLAFDLGSALERRGIQVSYTRVEDVYDTPYEKAAMGNQSGADFFVSIHRNAMPVPGTGSGIENLVFSSSGTAGLLGKNIGRQLAAVGWTDLGVKERPAWWSYAGRKCRRCWWKPVS